MRVFVKAKPSAGKEEVIRVNEAHFEVAVKEPPVRGKANKAVAKALAKHLLVSAESVKLVSGFTSQQKVFEIY